MVTTHANLPVWLRELYPFAARRLAVAGGEISYLDEGEGAEAVVMVHGNPTWSFFYRRLVLELRARFRCVVPDHLGCGLSDKPQDYDYTLANHIGNLDALIRHAGLKRWHLIVHDWGGPIGLGAAFKNLAGLDRVVIMNTAAFRGPIPWRIRVCRTPGLGEVIVRGLNGFAWPATWMAVSRPLPDAVKRGFLYPYGNWHDRIAVHRFVCDIPVGSGGGGSGAALDEITAQLPRLAEHPVLLLWGGRDFCFNSFFFEEWERRCPHADPQLLREAGHYLLEDAEDECGRKIAGFLNRR